MQTLINWTKNPIVVVDENGDRITIKPGQGKPVEGEFKNHPWVKKRRLEIAESDEIASESGGDDQERELLRQQYRSIFGSEPHGNSSAKTLRQKIEEWRDSQD